MKPGSHAAALSVREISYPPNLHQPLHAHPHASVTLVLSGSLEERAGARSERGLALGVVIKPAGVEHDDRFGAAGARTVQISIGGDAACELSRRGGVLERWRWIPVGAAVPQFLRLYGAVRSAAPFAAVQNAAWEVLAALDDPGGHAAGERHPGRRAAPAWLKWIRAQIDDSPAEPHRVRDLAAAAGVHPVHLAREFRRHYGCALSEHLQQRRLQAAAELLIASHEPIAAVAMRAGFADQSHLGRRLRSRAGVTPSHLRRSAGRPMLQTF
jgi:AraC family transcriptional regulator